MTSPGTQSLVAIGWRLAASIETDVSTIVVPPPQMVANMSWQYGCLLRG
jgi:hypothetical protein